MQYDLLSFQYNYGLLPYQRQLLQSSVKTDALVILQSNLPTRLKTKIGSKSIIYHSTNEEDEQLRMVMFAFLLKIFKSYTPKNQDNLNKLKTMIYNSSLKPSITTKQGIEAFQLYKCFAQKLSQLSIKEYVDQELSAMMNSSSFFEKVLFVTIQNIIGRKQFDCKHKRLSIIRAFMEKQFGIIVKIIENGVEEVEETDNQIVLHKIGNHLHKVCRMEPKMNKQVNSRLKENENVHCPIPKQESIKMDNSSDLDDFTAVTLPSKKGKEVHRYSNTEDLQSSDFVTVSWQKKKKPLVCGKVQRKGFFEMFCWCE